MKNFHYIALTAALLLAPAFALAEKERPMLPPPGQILKNIRETASTTRVEIKNVREEARLNIEAKKTEARTKIEAVKEKAKQKFSQAVQISVNNIIDRLTNNADHLGNIATRIDGRISELQAKGIPMDASVALLTTARADIAAAQDKVTAVGTALATALASATPKTEMPKVRAAVKAAEDAIHAAKDSLKATLDSIRAAANAPGTINQ